LSLSLEEIIDKIIKEAKISKKTVLEKINAKKQELGGLITDEGAAYMLAKELGVDIFSDITFKETKLSIKDLIPGMNNVAIKGRITEILPAREFTRNNGNKGYVANLIICDNTGSIKLVLWDNAALKVINGEIKKGDVVQIVRGYIKEGRGGQIELNVSNKGGINICEEEEDEFPSVEEHFDKISELTPGQFNVNVKGVVQRVFPQVSFKRKDGSEGKVLSLILNEEGRSIRVVFWNDKADEIENIKEGDILTLKNAYTKERIDGTPEIHVGANTLVRLKSGEVNSNSVQEVKKIKVNAIKEITPNMSNVSFKGIITQIGQLREFKKTDTLGKVLDIEVADETGKVKVVAWNEAAESLEKAKAGDKIIVEEGYTKVGLNGYLEVHIGRLGRVQLNPKTDKFPSHLELSSEALLVHPKRYLIKDIKSGGIYEILATIVHVYKKIPAYLGCPKCFKKLIENEENELKCPKCGNVEEGIPRVIFTAILDDGSSNIKANFAGQTAERLLGKSADELYQLVKEQANDKIENILDATIGRTYIFKCRAYTSNYSNETELNVLDFKEVDAKKEAEQLLNKLKNQ